MITTQGGESTFDKLTATIKNVLIELGPISSDQVQSWTRFARRIICELRHCPDGLNGVATPDLLDSWSRLIEEWELLSATGPQFRWSQSFEPDQAEYLLHGFERTLHSKTILAQITRTERLVQQPFTLHVVQAFIDGLMAEGQSCQQYVDQVRTSMDTMGAPLDH